MAVKFSELATIEPRLAELLKEARAVKDPGGRSFCANHVWYKRGGFKDRLIKLVGWYANDPRLKTSEAYDVAYRKIYDVLPACRNCNCL